MGKAVNAYTKGFAADRVCASHQARGVPTMRSASVVEAARSKVSQRGPRSIMNSV